MNYTIRQIANNIGVSKTAIQQFIRRSHNNFHKYLRKDGNKFLINSNGYNIILSYYKNRKHISGTNRKHSDNISDNEIIKLLKDTNNKQCRIINQLQTNLQTQQKLTSQQQQLQLSSQQEVKRLRSHIKKINGPTQQHGFIWRLFH